MSEKTDVRVWGIHTLDDELFSKENVIAIGWEEMGDLSTLPSDREEFKKKYVKTFPNDKKGAIAVAAGMLYRFCHEAQIGDYVIHPSKKDRMINIGIIKGDYYWENKANKYTQRREVKWLKHIPRTAFSQGALYEIGSAMTFFSVKNYADEYLKALDKDFKKNPIESDLTIGVTAEAIRDNTKDFILKELNHQLKGYDLENFVANLLEAMGYRATVSAHGGDRGIDIIAYKDELPPRITVQVKSQSSGITETILQSLKGAMMPGDYGLFVTLSFFTKNAQIFLSSNPIIRGIAGEELVDLILKYYELLDSKYQDMIPLEKVYIPIQKQDN